MAKTKEQKQQEAIDRNRRNLPANRSWWISKQPGGEAYEKHKAWIGKEDADRLAQEATRRFAKEMAAAHCDAHGNPVDLSWQRLTDQVVVIRFAHTQNAWDEVVVKSREKMFVQDASEKYLDVEYATWYEWGCAQRRMGNRLHQFDHKVIFSEGEHRHPTEWRKID